MGVSIIRNKLVPSIEIKTGTDSYYSVRKHSHRELSVGYIESGSSEISCKELDFKLKTGDILLIPPETVHLCSPKNPEKFLFKVIYIENKWFSETFGVDLFDSVPKKASLNKSENEILEKFCLIFKNCSDPLEVLSISVELLETLFFELFKVVSFKTEKKLDEDILKVKDHIDINFLEDLKLKDLSDLLKKDKYRLIRDFRKNLKLTPHSYLINKRIEYSKELLLKGSPVADAAVSSGFFDQSHFTKTFRCYTGMNPGDYSKAVKQ